ncbi:MAG: integrase core domain-containing protein [Planctomycetes bacterium]|nr:integrase core domain-containing protein [Planctomycetota bacterium]
MEAAGLTGVLFHGLHSSGGQHTRCRQRHFRAVVHASTPATPTSGPCTLGIQCSTSRTGCCYDNAVMERFFWLLKLEWTKHERVADLEGARLSVFKYVETFYNHVRLHQTLGYKTPTQYEADHAPASAA